MTGHLTQRTVWPQFSHNDTAGPAARAIGNKYRRAVELKQTAQQILIKAGIGTGAGAAAMVNHLKRGVIRAVDSVGTVAIPFTKRPSPDSTG